MSTDEGKNMILYPEGHIQIFHSFGAATLINKRVSSFFEKYFQSENVLQQFENLREELLSNFKSISSEISRIEREWIQTGTNDTERGRGYVFLPHPKVWISIWERLFFFYRAFFYCPFITKEGNESNVDAMYHKCKSAIKGLVYQHLKSNQGILFTKMVDKVTEDLLPKRITYLVETIENLRIKREEILRNQIVFHKLAEEVKDFQISARKIHSNNFQNDIKGNTTGLF